jgi:hypothetical protein
LLPAQVRPAALRQRLVDLNLALHVGPPVTFFEADLPPEQDFLQEKSPPRVCFGFLSRHLGESFRPEQAERSSL